MKYSATKFFKISLSLVMLFWGTNTMAQMNLVFESDQIWSPYYINGDTMIFNSSGFGTDLHITTDKGSNWVQVPNVTDYKIDKIIRFKGDYYIFENANKESVAKSDSSLSQWTLVNGFEQDAGTDGAAALISNGEYLWLKSQGASLKKNLYYVSENGDDWTEVNVGAFGKTDRTGNGFSGDSIISAKEDPDGWSLWSTTDDGINWEKFAHHDSTLNIKNVVVTEKVVYASMGNNRDRTHLFKYDLMNKSWSHIADGYKATLNYSAKGDTVVMANQTNKVYWSRDAGDSWTEYEDDGKFKKFYNPAIFGDQGYVLSGNGLYTFSLSGVATSNEEERQGIPRGISLNQNYPNPFNPNTEISFSLPVASEVLLNVYTVLGNKVATLHDGFLSSGQHTLRFNASHLSSGVYLYTLRSGSEVLTRKMVLIK